MQLRSPELLVFMSVDQALVLPFFMAPAFVRFHTLIFSIGLMCLKLNEK